MSLQPHPVMDAEDAGDLNVVHADWLARVLDRGGPRRGPDQGELDLIPDGAVAIRDGRIVAVGTTEGVLAEAGDDVPTIDAMGNSVLPGLVECHSHPLFAGSRHWEYVRKLQGADFDAIKREGGGIWASVLASREASDELLLAQSERAYRQILAGGVTTLEVKSGYGLTLEHELRALRLLRDSSRSTPLDLVYTFLGAHLVPADAQSAESYAETVRTVMLPAVLEQGIAEFQDLVCEKGVFERPLAATLLAESRRLGLPAKVHADASAPSEGWRTAVEGEAVDADHLTYTPAEEIREVGSTDTIAVLLPIAEQVYLDEQRANARLFMEQQVPVAIATDYCSSIHATSLLLSIATACSWYHITPAQAIVGATLNAAYVVGRGHDRGSLDLGRRGDLVVLDCPHPHEIGLAWGAPLVRTVVSRGRVVWDQNLVPAGVGA
jgi:imidazolonepropionase